MECWAIVWKDNGKITTDPGNGQYYIFDTHHEAYKALKNEEADGETRYEIKHVDIAVYVQLAQPESYNINDDPDAPARWGFLTPYNNSDDDPAR